MSLVAAALLAPMMGFHAPATQRLSPNMRASDVSMGGPPSYMFDSSSTLGVAMGSVTVVEPTAMEEMSGNVIRCDEDGCETFDLAPITSKDVEDCQANWAAAIASISKSYLDGGDYIQAAGDAAAELYGYGHMNVLFKPTKATDNPFRGTGESAMSYFVGGRAVDGGLDEDAGFAINGGKGWSKVVFKNDQVDYSGNTAIAMGTYWFTCATTGEETRVEYTFGYKRCDDGKPRIFLHHSSVPYAPSGSYVRCDEDGCEIVELPAVTSEDVKKCQADWAAAIASISKSYLDSGDYVKAAGDAAAELYGYGHTKVLFKPTKATDNPFRGCGESAMSYFVGADAVDNGLEEDAGFAINGGKGWSKVVFKNNEVDYSGNIAIAMGSYWFTCATTGDETRVEYTFGYKRCDDGKPRIFLHHSSVPYTA